MRRGGVDVVGRAGFDDASEVRDGGAVGDPASEAEVVGDEQVAEAEVFLELHEQVHDLGANADVEGADRFVADEEPGFDGEGAGDGDALAQPAGRAPGRAAFRQPDRVVISTCRADLLSGAWPRLPRARRRRDPRRQRLLARHRRRRPTGVLCGRVPPAGREISTAVAVDAARRLAKQTGATVVAVATATGLNDPDWVNR